MNGALQMLLAKSPTAVDLFRLEKKSSKKLSLYKLHVVSFCLIEI